MAGCTLADYAKAKGLNLEFLQELNLRDFSLGRTPAVEITYFDEDGEVAAVRYRTALEGDNRFMWRKGDKPLLYGINRLPTGGSIVIVEGESDAQTLWQHGIAAVGLPGASQWNERRDSHHLERFDTIYLVIEADSGGAALERSLTESPLAPKIKLVSLPRFKNVNEMHISAPEDFPARWERCREAAQPILAKLEKRLRREGAVSRRAICPEVAMEEDILGKFATDLMARLSAKPREVAV